jgi:hypothetical protein
MRQKTIYKSSDGTDLILVKSHLKDTRHSCENCHYDHHRDPHCPHKNCPCHKNPKNTVSPLVCIKRVFGSVEFFEFHKAFNNGR